MLEVAVLYGCDLSQVFTPIILRLYQPHSLCEKGATKAAAKAALYVFLLAPLREGRPMRPVPRSSQGVISTRAPTRGATQGADFPERNQSIISTRAPTRGATPPAARSSARPAISTRTPTRGATAIFHKTTS